MIRSTARRAHLGRTALLALTLMLSATALSQIGASPADFAAAAGAVDPPGDGDTFVTEGGVRVELELRGGALYAVGGEARLDDEALADAATVIALATGMGVGIEEPVADFLRGNAADLAGRGRVFVGVGSHQLMLDVRGEREPYDVSFRVVRTEVDASALPSTRHVLGPVDAPIVVREFSDFQCPFCKRFAEQVLPELKDRLLGRGDVRFEYHHFPLRSIHANAIPSAEASECVADAAPGDADAFWRFHDALFEAQDAWSGLADPTDFFVGLAHAIGVEGGAVEACIVERARRDIVERAYGASVDLQLTGTPSVFVNGYRIDDFTNIDAYLEAIALVEAFGVHEAADD